MASSVSHPAPAVNRLGGIQEAVRGDNGQVTQINQRDIPHHITVLSNKKGDA